MSVCHKGAEEMWFSLTPFRISIQCVASCYGAQAAQQHEGVRVCLSLLQSRTFWKGTTHIARLHIGLSSEPMLGELRVPQVPRPSSALSSRPASRSSHRHQARGRQSARHVPFVQDLVAQTLTCSKGDTKHAMHVETVMKALDSGRCNAPIWDVEIMDKRIKK
jgi:hypothetical protein